MIPTRKKKVSLQMNNFNTINTTSSNQNMLSSPLNTDKSKKNLNQFLLSTENHTEKNSKFLFNNKLTLNKNLSKFNFPLIINNSNNKISSYENYSKNVKNKNTNSLKKVILLNNNMNSYKNLVNNNQEDQITTNTLNLSKRGNSFQASFYHNKESKNKIGNLNNLNNLSNTNNNQSNINLLPHQEKNNFTLKEELTKLNNSNTNSNYSITNTYNYYTNNSNNGNRVISLSNKISNRIMRFNNELTRFKTLTSKNDDWKNSNSNSKKTKNELIFRRKNNKNNKNNKIISHLKLISGDRNSNTLNTNLANTYNNGSDKQITLSNLNTNLTNTNTNTANNNSNSNSNISNPSNLHTNVVSLKNTYALKDSLSFVTKTKNSPKFVRSFLKSNSPPTKVLTTNSMKSKSKQLILKTISPKENNLTKNDSHPLIPSFKNHYEYTKAGKDELGNEKTNQDSYLYVNKPFALEDNVPFTILGVMDGHGENGHYISSHISKEIQNYFTNLKCNIASPNQQKSKITSRKLQKHLTFNDYEIINAFYSQLNEDLKTFEYDNEFSGTTCVLVIILNNKLICTNIGDSRAILINSYSESIFTVEPLSNDHKPNNPKEKERIIEHGGIIECCSDENELDGAILRVWNKEKTAPGIAISRTIGDQFAKNIGVCCVPDVIEKSINCYCDAIIIGSDGVWDYLSNEKVMQIAEPFILKADAKGAAEAIVEESCNMWAQMGYNRDDITCVVYLFNKNRRFNK